MPDIDVPFNYTRSYTSANTSTSRLGPGWWSDSYSASIAFRRTGMRWHRELVRRKWTRSRMGRRVDRPPVDRQACGVLGSAGVRPAPERAASGSGDPLQGAHSDRSAAVAVFEHEAGDKAN
jgi:Domain of unknown function (DUF6531)